MVAHMQNPGLQAGASRNQLVGWLQPSLTPSQRQAQMLARRFHLSPAVAQEMAMHCFGEARDE